MTLNLFRYAWHISTPILLGALLIAQSSCQTMAENPKKRHHTPDGFRNNHPHENHGFGGVLKWKWDSWVASPPEKVEIPENAFPLAENDPAFLARNREHNTLTWIGHATLLLQVGGVNVLTDPHLSERASPFSWIGPTRRVPPGLTLEELPPIDVVIISHNHYDHLDEATVRALAGAGNAGPRFFVPLGLKRWFADLGVSNVEELDWWEERSHLGLTLTAVPVQHFSARSWFDRDETLWTGWVLRHPSLTFFFAGDTGYTPDFAEIARRMGPIGLAALPIGAYEPRWFMRSMHVNPAEAVQAHLDLKARRSMAMHWGTFDLTDEPLTEPPRALAAALAEQGIPPEKFFLMQHGETRRLDIPSGVEAE